MAAAVVVVAVGGGGGDGGGGDGGWWRWVVAVGGDGILTNVAFVKGLTLQMMVGKWTNIAFVKRPLAIF